MPDGGYWMLDTRCQILDAGYGWWGTHNQHIIKLPNQHITRLYRFKQILRPSASLRTQDDILMGIATVGIASLGNDGVNQHQHII